MALADRHLGNDERGHEEDSPAWEHRKVEVKAAVSSGRTGLFLQLASHVEPEAHRVVPRNALGDLPHVREEDLFECLLRALAQRNADPARWQEELVAAWSDCLDRR